MKSIRITSVHDSGLASVVDHLRAGGLIAYPTETTYGFGCALAESPLRILARAKRRDPSRPFLLLVPDDWRSPDLLWTPAALELAEEFWPGPLTLALQARTGTFPAEVTAPDGTVAIRSTSHALASTIVHGLGAPMTSTSANRPGEPPALDAAGAAREAEELGLQAHLLVVDSGPLDASPPSTLIRATADGVVVLREGVIGTDELRRVLGDAND